MLKVWMSHGDKVVEMPPGFKLMASTDACPIAGMADETRRFYGVQFHPEVTHTVQGRAILERFVIDICGARPDWIMRDHIEEAVQAIRQQVGDEEVILGLSGGVDSSVAAALIHRAIGDQLTCVFVDHGLLRLHEGDMVMDMFAGKLHAKVIRVDASDLFLRELSGVTDPEQKRKIIGRLFVDVFKAEAEKLKAARPGSKGVQWLAQGTIYPDVIESGVPRARRPSPSRATTTWVACPKQLGLKLLEPLRDLFKDEVRELGVALGLPHDMVYVTRSPVRAWGCAFWARSKRNMPTCCAGPMPSSSKNCAPPSSRTVASHGTIWSARRLRSFCPSRAWASWAMAAPTTTWWRCARCRPAIS
jgi:GMP synthase (glutamine-hydrolysing)